MPLPTGISMMKKTHNKSFILSAEYGNPLERSLMQMYPYITTSEGRHLEVIIFQCQTIVANNGVYIIVEVVLKKDFEE